MRSLIVEDGQLAYRTNRPKPAVSNGQALVRVLLAGICATDLEIVKGYGGFEGVLGHEFVGVVEEGPATWLGCRVVGSINIGCGQCAVCLATGPEHCPNRSVLGIINHDGAFADYLTLPLSNLLEVPDTVSDRQAVFTEPLAAALRIREQLVVAPTARVAVIGPGRLGMLVGMVLNLAGTKVVMIGRREESLILPRQMGLRTSLAPALGEDSYDLVVEATGNRDGLILALRLVRPLGTVVMKSTYTELSDVDLTKVVVGEVTLIGSRCGPFAPALRLLSANQVDVMPLIEAEYPLSSGLAAMAHAAEPGARKILLRL
jgi:threonine dehydrogenase-like Zn-dependent dehydrogenase